MRLDRFLTQRTPLSHKEISLLLAAHRILLDGQPEHRRQREIDKFTHIQLDSQVLQDHPAVYLMLHKPAGFLSATTDPQHPTVIELIDHPSRHQLHLAGRLDRASTGLLLLTNDGRWSRQVTEPVKEISKIYHVTTRDTISPETTEIFSRGIYFAYEDLTTRPAHLQILAPREALVTLHEGRYHQVKRMFHAVGNQVLTLHRQSIGPLQLDHSLPAGKSRDLTPSEVAHFRPTPQSQNAESSLDPFNKTCFGQE